MNEGQVVSLTGEDLLANQELDRRFTESMSQMDLEQIMNCFWESPGLIFVDFEGNVFLGYENVRNVMEQFLAQFETVSLSINEIRHFRAGDTVLAVGIATYETQTKDGSFQEVTERWTDARLKVEKGWVYAMDHIHLLTSTSN